MQALTSTHPTLLDMIRENEQSGLCALTPYRCPAGKLTIGWGRNIEAHPLPPAVQEHFKRYGRITGEMADQMLDEQLKLTIEHIRKALPSFDSFTLPRQLAFTDLCYNLGSTKFDLFKLTLKYARLGMWKECGEQLLKSKYAGQNKLRAQRNYALIRWGG